MGDDGRCGSLWPDLGAPLLLASTSPRRSEILARAGASFRAVAPAAGTESTCAGAPAEEAMRNAEAKARSVAAGARERFLLGADTVVACEGRILGKPAGRREATAMLRLLSGGRHEVITGIALLDRERGRLASTSETTAVWFRRLDEDEIARYVGTGEGADKAGGYAIQGIGGLFVRRIEGCYFNVVGLPLARTLALVREAAGGGES